MMNKYMVAIPTSLIWEFLNSNWDMKDVVNNTFNNIQIVHIFVYNIIVKIILIFLGYFRKSKF